MFASSSVESHRLRIFRFLSRFAALLAFCMEAHEASVEASTASMEASMEAMEGVEAFTENIEASTQKQTQASTETFAKASMEVACTKASTEASWK